MRTTKKYFHQEGALTEVQDLFNNRFQLRGQVEVYYFWGFIEDKAYKPPVLASLTELTTRIYAAVEAFILRLTYGCGFGRKSTSDGLSAKWNKVIVLLATNTGQ